MSIDKDPAFCVHPWTNLMVNNPGTYNFCCIAWKALITDEKGNPVLAANTMPDEAWNAPSLRKVRKAMVNGEKLDACSKCWTQEDVGKDSYRQRHNREWIGRLGLKEIEKRVQYTKDNDYYLNTPPDYLDLRLGNLCNLKCRMCNVYNSSQIEKEHLQLKTNNMYADMWGRQWDGDINGPPYPMDWVDAPKFWEKMSDFIPGLKKVYFTGGEPTLLPSTYTFMQEMVDKDMSSKIDLLYNINCTNVTDRFVELASKFRHVQIQASIDGTENVNDYIRAPSKWATIKKNLIKVAEAPGLKVGLSPAIQSYNILDIDNILEFAQDVSRNHSKINPPYRPGESVIDVDFLFVIHPTYFDPLNLPEYVRDMAFVKLQKWQGSWIYENSGVTRNSIDSYLTHLESKRNPKWETNMKEFWEMTRIFDKSRKQSFKDSLPQLYGMLNGTK